MKKTFQSEDDRKTKFFDLCIGDKKFSSWVDYVRKIGGDSGLTGWVRFVGNHVERPMALLEMKAGQIKLVKVIHLENYK